MAFGILLGMLPFLSRLNTSYNLAPLMNASALISGLLVPALTFMAAAIMLPQKVALSRVGAKIGALSDAALLPVVVTIYWLARTHPHVPVPSTGIKAAFVVYVTASLLLLILHICYIVKTRKDTMRGAARGYAFFLALVAVNVVIVGAFLLHFPALQSGPNLAEYGQNWITEMVYRLLYDSDGLSLGFAFQVLALLIATVLIVTGRRQYVLMGSVCAIAGYASMLVPLALTYREALKYDPFSFDRTPPPPNLGIDLGFIMEASAIASCLLLLHIVSLVLCFRPAKATQPRRMHSRTKAHNPAHIVKLERAGGTEASAALPRESSTEVVMRDRLLVIPVFFCLAFAIALLYSFITPLMNPKTTDSSVQGALLWTIPLSCLVLIIALTALRARLDSYFETLCALERTTLGFYCCYIALSGMGLLLLAAFTDSILIVSLVILLCLGQIIATVTLMHLAGYDDPTRRLKRIGLYGALIVLMVPWLLACWGPILSVIAQGYDPADYGYLINGRFTASLPPFFLVLDFIFFALRKRPSGQRTPRRTTKRHIGIIRAQALIERHVLAALFIASAVLAIPLSFVPELSSYYAGTGSIPEAFLTAGSMMLLLANMFYFPAVSSRAPIFTAARKVEAATVVVGAVTTISLGNRAGFLWYLLSPDRSDPNPFPVCVAMIALVVLTALYIRVRMSGNGPGKNLVLLLILACLSAYLWMYLPSLYAPLYCGIASYGFIAVRLIRGMDDARKAKHVHPEQDIG